MRMSQLLVLILLPLISYSAKAQNVRVKELAKLRGDRTNSLIGFGLVIGLNKTGDSPQSFAKNKAIATLLSRLGMQAGAQPLLTAAAAAVIVTADLPPFARIGDRIDVKVSVIGDAKSLAGGNLLMTPLKGPDGQLYAMADGSILVGQASGGGAKVQTVAVIPNAGVIEKDFTPSYVQNQAIELNLMKADFSTSNNVALAINRYFHDEIASAVDPARVRVRIPEQNWTNVTGFIAQIEALEVAVDQRAMIIINERTGTVVMGGDVKVSEVAITHNGLSITVGSGKQGKSEAVMPLEGTTVGDLVKSLNQMGVKPEDLVSILQSIHASGALRADIKVM
jgi:flagellar P-ring protein precursor FlgI